MDVVTGAVIIVGLQKVAAPAAQVLTSSLARMLSAPADALGEAMAEPIREWQRKRVARAEQVVLGAAALVAKKKEKMRAVPGRVLLPILERSSVEEDNELRDVWSRLLASAAMPNPNQPVLTAYAHILAELTPVEVKILSFVAQHGMEKFKFRGDRNPLELLVFRRATICKQFRISPSLALTIRDNLVRLNLLEAITDPPTKTTAAIWPYFVTYLGSNFLRACRGPV